MDYQIKDPSKVHTRYSELLRCTTKQIHEVLDERQGLKKEFKGTTSTSFGKLRHDMFMEESQKTGKTPSVFDRSFDVQMVEEEIETEIIPGVILHSRPDAFSINQATVIDYKTMGIKKVGSIIDQNLVPDKYRLLNGGFKRHQITYDVLHGEEIPGIELKNMNTEQYAKFYRHSRQLITYAYVLYANGHHVGRTIYMIEVWNKADLEIIDHAYLERNINLADIMANKKWLEERAGLLLMAMRAKGLVEPVDS